jgi:hypothetical protein
VNQRNRRLHTVSDRLYRASENVMAALDHLDRQRGLVPSIVSSRTDSASSSRSGHSDRTTATVIRLDSIDYGRRTILDAIATAETVADLIDQAVRDAYRITALNDPPVEDGPNTDDRPICRGGPPDTWGDAICGAHVEHFLRDDGTVGFRSEGLCAKHRTAKRRWERENAA